ncbi:MAG: hypothetical protein ACI30V_01460 [Muribaculaceae bacterium]
MAIILFAKHLIFMSLVGLKNIERNTFFLSDCKFIDIASHIKILKLRNLAGAIHKNGDRLGL